MRRLLSACLWGLALLVAIQPAIGQQSVSDAGKVQSEREVLASFGGDESAEPWGLVYGYGVRMEAPYIFTRSGDGKTLYLNELIYDGPGEGPPPEITVTAAAVSRHELAVSAYEYSRQAGIYEERIARYAEALRQSPLVERVREFEQGVYITWRSSPEVEEEAIIPREESQFDLQGFQQSLVSRFEHTVGSGGMIAFGKRYHVYVPRVRLPKTLQQIDLVQSGAGQDQLDTGSTALQNKSFLRDLFRAVQGPEEETP
jgi:hypothetical protein